MGEFTSIFEAGTDGDRAEQAVLVRDRDRELGLDTTALHPLAERVRAAFDTAATADRIDQNTIVARPREYAWLYDDYLDDDWDDPPTL
ncbi:hypothetical protein KHQ06_16120 [Nocardia tengchongensis]|uniref:Uncharacterized protein n=1 Tax=Nocardia tengchongensis TaxID=2055889 RepID=A0ABX8CW75_9NOCA|nr:hypothetical protein [Nocardia tengchongensis]QVI24161.1 hypothetical protein KHQ06_16120 [Nocardia tengchongensis]